MPDPFEELRSYATHLESSVPPGRAQARAAAALRTPASRRPRAVVALATVAFMSVSNVAMAAVADPAAPGDALYGVDRAYERVAAALGIGGDNRLERLDEAATVAGRGDSATALELVMESLEGLVDDDAETARAVLAALENGADVSQLQAQVQAMIEIARRAAEGAHDGSMRGQADLDGASGRDIAEIARKLRETLDLPAQSGQDSPGDAAGDNRGGPADDTNPGANGPPGSEDSDDSSPGATTPGSSADSPSDTRPSRTGAVDDADEGNSGRGKSDSSNGKGDG